jgi:hypothetical protein
MDSRGRLLVGSAVATLALVCTACGGSIPPPNEHLASSEAAARSAHELGAQNNPQAALYLQLASEENQQARRLMRSGDNERADGLLLRSRADAELSVMLAKEASARAQADQAEEVVRKAKSAPMPNGQQQQQQPQQPMTPQPTP